MFIPMYMSMSRPMSVSTFFFLNPLTLYSFDLLISLKSYGLAPQTTLLEIKTILMALGTQLGPCHVYCIATPQSSDFLSEAGPN
jgi:hypothetical protein